MKRCTFFRNQATHPRRKCRIIGSNTHAHAKRARLIGAVGACLPTARPSDDLSRFSPSLRDKPSFLSLSRITLTSSYLLWGAMRALRIQSSGPTIIDRLGAAVAVGLSIHCSYKRCPFKRTSCTSEFHFILVVDSHRLRPFAPLLVPTVATTLCRNRPRHQDEGGILPCCPAGAGNFCRNIALWSILYLTSLACSS